MLLEWKYICQQRLKNLWVTRSMLPVQQYVCGGWSMIAPVADYANDASVQFSFYLKLF
jgi:hypothetical protein